MRKQLHRLLATAPVVALLLLAGFWCIRLASADWLYRQATAEGVRAAIRLEPRCALYHAGYAELLADSPGDAIQHLRQAVALKPDDAFLRMRLGLMAESLGNLEEAEQELRAAARASGKYEPRWTLANYFFRRGDEREFWPWIRQAARMSYADRAAIFELCWRMRPDPARIERIVPERRSVQLAFASFLAGRAEWDRAAALYDRLVASAGPDEVPTFLHAVERGLDAGRPGDSLHIWNSLVARSLVPLNQLDPERGPWIANPAFDIAPSGVGFDWRLGTTTGIYVSPRAAGLRLEFSGGQPENCEILHQLLFVRGDRRYRLRYEFELSADRASRPAARSGVIWRVAGRDWTLLAESPELAAGDAGSGLFDFEAPAGKECLRLSLAHVRRPGAVRFRGTVHLERVTLSVPRHAEGE
jgi:tetratricopeptide (TPR) repeat protein